MAGRGRESAASKAVRAPSDNAVEIVGRPEAPSDLTDEQAQEWRSIVALLPADYFPRESHALLTSYCRHTAAQRKIAMLIDAMEGPETPFCIDTYDKLLKMQDRESRTVAALMRAMRLTQQSKYDKSKKRDAHTGFAKPWATKD